MQTYLFLGLVMPFITIYKHDHHKKYGYYVLLNHSLLTRGNEQRVDIELMDNRNLSREAHNSIHCPGNDSNAKNKYLKVVLVSS